MTDAILATLIILAARVLYKRFRQGVNDPLPGDHPHARR